MAMEALKEQLNSWHDVNCSKGPLSWQWLAKRSGISESYICKIARGEAANPSFRIAKSLMLIVLSHDIPKVYRFLKEFYPEETPSELEFLQKNFTHVDDKTVDLLRDKDNYRIYKIALSGKKTVQDISRDSGVSFAEERAVKLVEAGVLVVDEATGKLSRSEAHKKTIVVDPDRLANEFGMVNEILREKKQAAKLAPAKVPQIDELLNRYMFYHDCVNDDAVAYFVNKLTKFLNDTHKELSQQKYKGDIPLFCNIAAGRFDDK